MVGKFRPSIIAGLAGYFVGGYFLNKVEISPKIRRIIYIVGIIGYLEGQILATAASLMNGEPVSLFYIQLSVSRLCASVAVFVFFKSKLNRPSQIIRTLSKYSFGAYLVHHAVISVIMKTGLTPLSFNPLFSVPVITVIVFIFSFAISAALNHIPILQKHIV